jgi:hypothetical protein
MQHADLAYNARRQRVLDGQSPDQVVQARLEAKPELANPAYQPPGPCDRTKTKIAAQLTVYSAKDVSHPDSYAYDIDKDRVGDLGFGPLRWKRLRRRECTYGSWNSRPVLCAVVVPTPPSKSVDRPPSRAGPKEAERKRSSVATG